MEDLIAWLFSYRFEIVLAVATLGWVAVLLWVAR